MKKTRYIPYGYTMRNGRTVISGEEAEVIREIFKSYLNGASLKAIADELTDRQIPYTQKTATWDKARIARIIDNARYAGTEEYVEKQVSKHGFEIIISHTCPFKYEPIEAFLPAINQSMVDDSTERWLDEIEEKASYKAWLCGHWHIDKRVDKMRFLFHDVVTLEMIKRGFK